ncbi:unnamed protein product [Pichia kudriavzevii]
MHLHHNSKKSGKHVDSLKAQFSETHSAMPLSDIPSLPTPRVKSPIYEHHVQEQLNHHLYEQLSSPVKSNYSASASVSQVYSTRSSPSRQQLQTHPIQLTKSNTSTTAYAPTPSTSSESSLSLGNYPGQNTNSSKSQVTPTNPKFNEDQLLSVYNTPLERPNSTRTPSSDSATSHTSIHQQQHYQQQLRHQHHQLQQEQQHQLQQQQQYFNQNQQSLSSQAITQQRIPSYNFQHQHTQLSSPAYERMNTRTPQAAIFNQQQAAPQAKYQQQQIQQKQHNYTEIVSNTPQVPLPQQAQQQPTLLQKRNIRGKLPPINTQPTMDYDDDFNDSPLTMRKGPSSLASDLPNPHALCEHNDQSKTSTAITATTPSIYRPQTELLPGKAFGIKQRSGSEYSNSSRQKSQIESAKRSPSLPVTREGFSSNVTPLSYQSQHNEVPKSPSQDNVNPSSSIRKSPIIRQSINFLKNARNFSSSSINQMDSPTITGHSSAREMEKYHFPSKQATSNGRTIPQKVDYNANSVRKSRSFSTLTRRVTSNSSLRQSADKGKIASATSLASSALVSSVSVKKRYIYPALLSEVADAFLHEIKLSCHFKYGIEYRNSFSGAEAVDILCKVTRTRDRNLGIIIGRSLDAQRLFHDVTYEHRLRDNKNEIYLINDEFLYDQSSDNFRRQNSIASNMTQNDEYSVSTYNNTKNEKPPPEKQICGVFTLLTECYSPTCTVEKLCYSVSCPRRFEQKMRQEAQLKSLVRSDSHSLFTQDDQKQYWQLSVPKSLLDSLDKREIKRQECIFETINSEKTFIKDLEYIREFWIRPLSETKIIKDKERDHFIRNVFHNINEIWEVNHKFAEALIRRQQKNPYVETIADIFLEYIPQFTPFLTYGAGQVIGKYEFDRQRRHNPLFRRFIEDTAKREESKRLDLSSFLSKPTTRPARYPLLLKSIKDHTDPESPDYKRLGSAIELLEKMLTKINYETGKQSDKMNLFQIKQKLIFKPGELVDLKLSADNRKVIYQCVLKKKGYQEKEKQGEIHVYLFDHCLLFVKIGYVNKREVYRVYQRPIPLPLLFFSTTETAPTMRAIRKLASKTGSAPSHIGPSLNSTMVPLNSTVCKSPLSFKYLGTHEYELTLYGTPATQKILSSKIEAQTNKILADNDVYTLTPLCSNFFDSQNRINCVVPFDGGRKLLYGTDSGVYVSDRSSSNNTRVKVIGKVNVIQAEIIQEYQLFIALCDKKLIYWPLSTLQDGDPNKNAKLGKELMNHVSFFKTGVCDGRMLVCAAKSTSNIVRIFEPVDPIQQKKQKKKFNNNKEDIHFSSEPVSINFLKTKLCVGCSSGFQIVSLVNNSMEELLDPADTSLEFATGKEGLKPLNIDRINSDFLLSYSSFSFFINHNGWRVRPKWMIEWEGVPHAFALWYPYLLAFDSNFIEIRSVQNGDLLRVIVGENIRFLHASSQEIMYAFVDDRGYDVVASLDFWDKSMKNSRSRGNTVSGNSQVEQLSA